jgi:hypothetical protein
MGVEDSEGKPKHPKSPIKLAFFDVNKSVNNRCIRQPNCKKNKVDDGGPRGVERGSSGELGRNG